MKRIKAFGAFWYDFVIGDDWQVALGVALALAATFLLSRAMTFPLWWLVPAVVVVLLPVSIYRATRAPADELPESVESVQRGQPPSPASR
jgi:hypothetical protein